MKKLVIAIPAYNEEKLLKKNILKLYDFCKKNLKNYEWKIIIGNNASTDKTLDICKKLKKKYKQIDFIDRKDREKSSAIKEIWLSQEANIYMYMDADLSTDINHISELIKAIEKGYDIAIGSRTSKKSTTARDFNRHFFSIALILMLKLLFFVNLSDFQCGFKAINKRTRDNIIPKTRHTSRGFMDTEMLILAYKKRYKIKEIPVKWNDIRPCKFHIPTSILHFLWNMLKVRIDLFLGRY